jgi:hypothetical protein
VLEPGATTREVYLPAGDWVDFWRAVAFDSADGALVLQGGSVTEGGTSRAVPAPLDEIPLFVRAGAVLALLPPDVDTLAEFGAGAPGLVRAVDRADELRLLVFPRGESTGRFLERGRYRSVEGSGRWELAGRAERPTTWTIEASLATLESPFTPCGVRLNGRRLADGDWSFEPATRVLRARASGRSIRLEVHADCP